MPNSSIEKEVHGLWPSVMDPSSHLIALYVIVVTLALSACAETFDSSYSSHAAAVEAGAVKAGWVPSWLPHEARDIREVHDIDTNARMLVAMESNGTQLFVWAQE